MSLKNESIVNDEGKNMKQITCAQCKSKILPPNMGTYVSEPELELASFKTENAGQLEKLNEFFRVEDMFDFDNLGFTNTIDNLKFLSCADCNLGPIGYHDLNTKLSFIALSRVQFID
ncbi:guanine nucleotide exchange factor MSS4 homolog [Eurytemora carolleeae]|uniref:guanine nucleotide exchange factor MSS4 homolog n=1 Tax=Eurytemora carolleeae TaxID=1294199 RepID=UPI000C7947E9|nr:guanine nucleotide exchange factor MSS4 homolog [Eurytemora carolleeae]|eukprot:XP_023330554.1 guanine nucleotide exchange factor MSS4 homolog [Eurytemora affinis]